MDFQDALRAQYFIRSIEEKLKEVTRIFSCDLSCFLIPLCHQLDQMLLPTIAYEIGLAKDKGLLHGDTPQKRYESFFLQKGTFTDLAKQLPEKYPFLFQQLDQAISDAFANLNLALKRAQMEQAFPSVSAVSLLSESDKHRGQQTLLFTFEDQSKWVYKPRDLKPDQLLKDFISYLQLDPSYALIPSVTFSREGYGWMEFQHHLCCQSKQDIYEYYQRAGVLLAIADTLNYSDGHFENLIACGPYPTIIDCETLFQNYSEAALKEKSILSTGLIQKVKLRKKSRTYFSAFQATEKEVYHVLYPHALNERSDQLKVEFHGFQSRSYENLPYIDDTFYLAQDFGAEIMKGIQYGYKKISEHADDILAKKSWWETLSTAQARTLKHHTVNYAFLMRRIQQPDACRSQEVARKLIQEKLQNTSYSSYETEDLLNGNIPYFFHFPSDASLYDGNGNKYPPETLETSSNQIKRNLKENPVRKIDEAHRLIKLHLGIINHETSPAA